jgi:hypothetical protein
MADIQVWALRDAATKQLMGWSLDSFEVQVGQEQVQETIDDADFDRFNIKYRFNPSSGDLEINGKTFYRLQITEDATQHNPITGVPQLDAGNTDYLTMTIQKEDIDGNDQTDPSDDDRIYLTFSGGDAEMEYVDLVNGAASGQIHASTAKGIVKIALASEDIADAEFSVETI